MHVNHWIRQFHRWVSVVFTLAVAVNLFALGRGIQALWIGMLALFPLVLLMLTGLYLFVLPYIAKERSARQPRV